MRTGDLLHEAVDALRASRLRTTLTALGITVGTLALALILSLALGLSGVVDELVGAEEQLRHVFVTPGFGSRVKRNEMPKVEGEMSEAKRARLAKTLRKRSRRGPSVQMRTRNIEPKTEQALASLDGVEDCRAFLQDRFDVELLVDGEAKSPNPNRTVLSLAMPAAHPYYPARLVGGRWFEADDQRAVAVHELLLYDLGYTSDEQQAALVGSTLRLTCRKRPQAGLAAFFVGSVPGAASDLPVLYTEELTLVAVVRERFGNEPASLMEEGLSMHNDLFLPQKLARELWARTPGRDSVPGLLLVARSLDDVVAIEDRCEKEGLRARSVRLFVERIKQTLSIATIVAGFLAAIAVFVAGLGIVNTMVMSVLERTREIGLLKAIGATDRLVATLFLVEGALLGALGGAAGVALAFGLSLVGNEIGRDQIEQQFLMPFEGDLFVFPPWLVLAGLAFSVLTSVAASVVPAVRASRIDPVEALRHE